jgi:hypothetical protein
MLWQFNIFPRFGILCQEKSGNPGWPYHTLCWETACLADLWLQQTTEKMLNGFRLEAYLCIGQMIAEKSCQKLSTTLGQGCQMAYFQTKNHYLGKFWWDLQCKVLVFKWPFGIHILWPFGKVLGHLVYFLVIWYVYIMVICNIFFRFGMLATLASHWTEVGLTTSFVRREKRQFFR